MHSDQRLVGGNHVFAVFDGFKHQLMGDGVAADQLDDDVDFWVGGHREHIVGGSNTGNVALRVLRTQRNLRHFDATPCAPGNFLGVALEHIERTATDGTQPTDAYFDRFHHLLRETAHIPWAVNIKEPHLTKRLSISQSAQKAQRRR